jgi:dipeptidyl-peptidase-3
MRKLTLLSLLTITLGALPALRAAAEAPAAEFKLEADRFADIQVLRYPVPGFEKLTLQQKKLAYYLYEAGLSGRDIFWDQKCGYNLLVRKTLEGILTSYQGERTGADWTAFQTYAKQVFFANGIHHHYANTKFLATFPASYLSALLEKSDPAALPLQGKSVAQLASTLAPILFDPKIAPKNTNLDAGIDNIVGSANNFYRGVTAPEVEAFYKEMEKAAKNPRLTFGLNSQLTKVDGKLVERTWKVGGMYGPAIEHIVGWLEKAATVAENDNQKQALEHLIRFYRTGDINDFDQYCIAWVTDTKSTIDAVNGFIETYVDAAGKRGGYESVVSVRDDEATKRIAAIAAQAQWFEDHSPILPANKKKNVTGISAKVITIIGETGDAAPTTPIGINLPNAEWIREEYGSKSVSLGNIIEAYNDVQAKSPATDEFADSPEVASRLKQWGALANDLHVDMHEVIGHASGQLNPGVTGTDVLKNYAGTLEEARADLVGLYYILDPKLVEIGVMPMLDVGKAGYDKYVMNGLMQQLNRIKPGDNLQEAHMRNRQLIAAWALEKGAADKVIERIERDGKTYFRINDYDQLRNLFGQLLREIQRIKSEGDFAAGQALVENYGVKVDQALLAEVHARYKPLNLAPYYGFIQPRLVTVMKNGEIADVVVQYPDDFLGQMLEYGRNYSFLPVVN